MHNLKKRKNLRLRDFDYNTPGAYFLTVCTQNRQCILSRIFVGTGVLDCPISKLTECGKIADKYINQLNNFYDCLSIEDYVIMPNHIHLMLRVNEKIINNGQSRTPVPTINNIQANNLCSQFISTFKRFCNKEYGKNIWQTRSYDHIIRNIDDYEEHRKYILENPIKWHCDELYAEE